MLVVQQATGNAAKAGIQAGDTIIYTSSFFGDELWPADKLGFANSAINACPSPVAFVYIKVGYPSTRPSCCCMLLALLRSPCLAIHVLLQASASLAGFAGLSSSRVCFH